MGDDSHSLPAAPHDSPNILGPLRFPSVAASSAVIVVEAVPLMDGISRNARPDGVLICPGMRPVLRRARLRRCVGVQYRKALDIGRQPVAPCREVYVLCCATNRASSGSRSFCPLSVSVEEEQGVNVPAVSQALDGVAISGPSVTAFFLASTPPQKSFIGRRTKDKHREGRRDIPRRPAKGLGEALGAAECQGP